MILSIYISTSVINWVPIIPFNVVRVIKYLLFIYIFHFEYKHNQLFYPTIFLSPIGLFLILLSMVLGSLSSFNISRVVDILLPFIILWIFNFDKKFYYKVLYRSSIIVSFLCFCSIISSFTGILNLSPNGPWHSTFGEAALGGYSTGYSNSLFLYIPFIVFHHRRNNKKLYSTETFCILLILTSQYLSGGRAGLLSSLLVFFLSFRLSIVYKVILIMSIYFIYQTDSVQKQMRIISVNGDELTTERISSGRVSANIYYFDKFLEQPISGYGFGEKDIYFGYEPHLVWLKNVINGGILYLLLLFVLFGSIFIRAVIKVFDIEEKRFFFSLFTISFIITFLEPNYLIGSVQGELPFWICMSLFLKHTIPRNTSLKFNS